MSESDHSQPDTPRLPDLARFTDVALGKGQWTKEELELRSVDPEFRMGEAETFAMIAMLNDARSDERDAYLKRAVDTVLEMPTPELSRFGFDVLFEMLPVIAHPALFRHAPAEPAFTERAVHLRQMANELEQTIGGYVPAAAFWDSVFPDEPATKDMLSTFTETYGSIPAEIGHRIDKAIISVLEGDASLGSARSEIEAVVVDLKQLQRTSPPDVNSNDVNRLLDQLNALHQEIGHADTRRAMRDIVQEMRDYDIPNLPPRPDAGSPFRG